MPEGPSIVILKEQAAVFGGKKVLRVAGNSKQPISRALNQTVRSIRSWGKHFLIEFSGYSIRIHMLLFGSYRINDDKSAQPRLSHASAWDSAAATCSIFMRVR